MENGAHYRLILDVAEIVDLNQAKELVKSHPFIKGSKHADTIASILLMGGQDETIPMNNYKAFFEVFGPKCVDDRGRFITRWILWRLYEMDRIFPEKSPTRGSNTPTRLFLAYRFFVREVNKIRSKKLRTQAIAWFDNHYPKEEKFKQITTIKKLDDLFKALMSDFNVEVIKPWKHKTASFSRVVRFRIIARTNWRCQWKLPDGHECGVPLKHCLGQIDHIVQRRLGGPTTPQNSRWICKTRNQTWGRKCMLDIET